MNLDLDALFPEGLSDETITAVAEVFNDLAMQWERGYFHRIRAYQAQQQLNLFDPEQPWQRNVTD